MFLVSELLMVAGGNEYSLLPLCSVLSQSVVRSKFLDHCKRSSLTAEERQTLKKIVEEELLRMQVPNPSPSPLLIRGILQGGENPLGLLYIFFFPSFFFLLCYSLCIYIFFMNEL